MEKSKQARLVAAGWAVSTPKEFLGLTEEEEVFIEVKLALANALKMQRVERHLSQVEAARRLHSSQSRVAKMEAADKSVSVDLILRSLLKLGGTRAEVAAALPAAPELRSRT